MNTQNQTSLAKVYRFEGAMSVRIKVEDDLLKELSIFDAERKESGTNTSFVEIKNIEENTVEDMMNVSAHQTTFSNASSLNSTQTRNANGNQTKIIKTKLKVKEENGKFNIAAN